MRTPAVLLCALLAAAPVAALTTVRPIPTARAPLSLAVRISESLLRMDAVMPPRFPSTEIAAELGPGTGELPLALLPDARLDQGIGAELPAERAPQAEPPPAALEAAGEAEIPASSERKPVMDGLAAAGREFAQAAGNASTARAWGQIGKFYAEQPREGFSVDTQHARDEVMAERVAAYHVAHAQAHARPEVLDDRPESFTAKNAREFAEKRFDLGGPRPWSGRKVLLLLMTPHALEPGLPVDPRRMDLSLFGRATGSLRGFAKERGLDPIRLENAISEALRLGLVYRARDFEADVSYAGVPHRTRSALGLRLPPRPAVAPDQPAKTGAPARLRPFGSALAAFSARLAPLSAKDELFELAAQAILAAAEAGFIPESGLNAEFVEKARGIGFSTPRLSDALITLIETARGTPLQGAVAELAELALGEDFPGQGEVRDLLQRP